MKALFALTMAAGALAASPVLAQDTAVAPGYVQGGSSPSPLGILALPFQIAAALDRSDIGGAMALWARLPEPARKASADWAAAAHSDRWQI